MERLVRCDGVVLERVLEATYPAWHRGLTRDAYAKYDAALGRTRWGRRSRQRVALMDGARLLASAVHYRFVAVLDGSPVPACGIGELFTSPPHRGHACARALLEEVLEHARRDGAEMAVLFSTIGAGYYERHGFRVMPRMQSTLVVTESARYGAPMTMVRGGEDRDLQAIAAMGQVRAEPCRFHLDRDVDLIQYVIARRRLLAGLGPAGSLQLQFFIAEEGTTAAAYAVISVAGDAWTIEECGDRDPSGARVGALLQASIAREPAERRPTIAGWLPPGFLPPQVSVVSAVPPAEVMMIRSLNPSRTTPELAADEVLYWHGDLF